MRVGKPLYAVLADTAAEVKHVHNMIEDVRDGNGHPTDLAKIQKSLTRAQEHIEKAIALVSPKNQDVLL